MRPSPRHRIARPSPRQALLHTSHSAPESRDLRPIRGSCGTAPQPLLSPLLLLLLALGLQLTPGLGALPRPLSDLPPGPAPRRSSSTNPVTARPSWLGLSARRVLAKAAADAETAASSGATGAAAAGLRGRMDVGVATQGTPGAAPGGPSGSLPVVLSVAAAALATACALLISRPLLRRQLRVFTMAACVVLDYKATKKFRSAVLSVRARVRRRGRGYEAAATGEEAEKAAAREAERAEAEEDALWTRVHRRNAERVFRGISSMEGLWVKAGQYLSTRSDVMPDPYIDKLKLLQDTLPPRHLQEVYACVQEELGGHPKDLFRSFDPSPIGTASIAQVHRAVSLEGEEVVVKVQHKGVKQRILQDLGNLRTIVRWVAWLEPDYNFGPVVEEWAKEVPKELDFRVEAQNLRDVSASLGGAPGASANGVGGLGCSECPRCGKHWAGPEGGVAEKAGAEGGSGEGEGGGQWQCECGYAISRARDRFAVDVELPQVRMATEKVLVMSYMDGVRLNDEAGLDRFGVDRQRLVEGITRAYAHQIYIDGLFNADPHPGNFLVSKSLPHRPILLDFGLTKRIDQPMREALAKMLLATAQGDAAMLLSAFEQMGLRLRTDVPDDALTVTSFFFRRAAPPKESQAEAKSYFEGLREKAKKREEEEEERMRKEQEQQAAQGQGQGTEAGGARQKQMRRNPVDAFPGELVFFIRVLNLLRGLSSGLGARVAYLDVMRPFAEAALSREQRPQESPASWFRAPSLSQEPLRSNLQKLLWGFHQQGKVLGMQVCAYKGGQVVVDAAAGYLGEYDPRPVQPDSLFPVFSATKGVTAGLLHWLALEKGALSFNAPVASLWPEFAANGKEACTVAHVLTHRAGLENALAAELVADPMLLCRWEEMKRLLAAAAPASPPGAKEAYHYLTYGWLAGGVAEGAGGRPFQELVQEVFAKPLGVEGEFYVGIPPGVETRLASLCFEKDTNATKIIRATTGASPSLPSSNSLSSLAPTEAPALQGRAGATSQPPAATESSGTVPHSDARGPHSDVRPSGSGNAQARSAGAPGASGTPPAGSLESVEGVDKAAEQLPLVFNSLFVRRAVIPSANGHFSARALARYYAALAAEGKIPPPPPTALASQPPLGTTAPKPRAPSPEEGAGNAGGVVAYLRRAAGSVGSLVGSVLGTRPGKGHPGGPELDSDSLGEKHSTGIAVLEEERGQGARASGDSTGDEYRHLTGDVYADGNASSRQPQRLFGHPKAVDSFLGIGDFAEHADPYSHFGLGFVRFHKSKPPQQLSPQEIDRLEKAHPEALATFRAAVASPGADVDVALAAVRAAVGMGGAKTESRCAFGHAGLGGSVAFADPNHDFAIAVCINQLCFDRQVVGAVVRLVCTEMGVPVPSQFRLRDAAAPSPDTMVSLARHRG